MNKSNQARINSIVISNGGDRSKVVHLAMLLLLAMFGLPSAVFADATWVGGTSQDWNDGSNWSINPPTGSFFINTTNTGIFPIISANSAFTAVDINVGSGGLAGRVDQNAGTNSTGSGNWLLIAPSAGGVGTYNLNGGTLNAGAIHMTRVGSGSSTATLNVSGTVNSAAETVVVDGQNGGVSGAGTLNVNSGGILNSEGDLLVAFAGGGTGAVNIASNAIVNVASTTKRWVIVNEWDTTHGQLTVNGGTLNLNANTDIQFSTGSYQPGASQGASSVTLNSGTITSWSGNQTGAGSGVVNLNNDGTSAGISNTFNLNGGTLTIGQVASGQNAGTRIFNFNGGTLKPTASTTAFMNLGTGNAVANVRNNGGTVDNGGFAITIMQPLVHSTVGGDNATDGGMTFEGAGTTTLGTGNSYNGTTRVLGGTLNLTPTTFSVSGDLLVSNAIVVLDISSGSSLMPANLTLQTNTILNLSFGSMSGNPSFAAINASGGLVSADTNTINITGTGWVIGQFSLIKYTGTALSSISNIKLGSLPAGVAATLVNNTANHSIDLNITFAGQSLTWYGADNLGNPLTTWNINTSTNWNSGTAKYLQYSGNTYGDNVAFNDSVFSGDTNVNLAVRVVPSAVLFSSSSQAYTVTGTGGIDGSTSLIVTNSGSLFLGTSNNYTGGTIVGGGSLIITNDNALGATSGGVSLAGGILRVVANTTNTSRAITVTANSMIDVPTNLVSQSGGVVSGGGSLIKTNAGTLILTGSNLITGTLAANGGTLVVSGTNLISAVPIVGNAAGFNGALHVAGGLFQDNNNPGQPYFSSLIIGNVAGAAGDMIISGGTVTIPQQLAVGPASYGAYGQSGGNVTIGGFIALGGTVKGGVFNQTGGTLTMTNSSATIGFNATNTYGVMNLSGTAVFNTFNNGGPFGGGVWPGEVGNGTLNVSGGAALTITNDGISFGRGSSAGNGTVNLNGGMITAGFITCGPGSGTFNFNGGTLRANAGGTFTEGNVATVFNVYSNGAVIDDGGNNITFTQPLQGATNGYGLADIQLADGGSGYVDTPIVTISDALGYGSNATATATVDPVNGTITGVIITCPGSGFDPISSTLSINFIGGGANPTQPNINNYDFIPLAGGGGLTKKGSGTLTLSGANIYTGITMVTNGTLYLTPAQQTATPVVVANGATFGISSSSVANPSATIGNLTLGSAGAATLSFSYGTAGNPTNVALTAGAVAFNGGSSIKIGGVFNVGTFPLLKYSSLSSVPTMVAPRGTTATLSNSVSQSTLYVVVTAVGGGIVWTGNTGLIPNLWDVNVTTNWLTGSTPTTYQETVPPGDAATFNDLGSGTVLVSNTVSPASVTVTNSGVAYTFHGNGQINSALGLTKLGSGTVTLGLPGTYSGNTAISSGTVNVNANQTFANLTGSGAISNTTGTPILIANNSTNTTFSGSIHGGLGLTKTGNGTLTLSGTGSSINGILSVDSGSLSVTGGSTTFGSGASSVGYLTNSGDLTMTGGSLTTGGELRVGGSDQNGTAYNAVGTVNLSNATLSVGSLTVARGNNPQNTVSGTVTLNSNSTLNCEGDCVLDFAGGVTGKVVINGGTLNHATTIKRWLIMSTWDFGSAEMDVNSGQVNINANTDIRFATQGNTGTNIFNLNGGAVTFYSDNHTTVGGTGVVDLHQGNGSTVDNTFNLNGGILTVSGILSANTSGTRIFNFNSGTLKAVANNSSFVNLGTGSAAASVRNGGAIIDSAGFNVTIPQVLRHSIIDGDNVTDGGLTKLGTGTLYLDGANTYTGNTVISNGILAGIGSVAGNVTAPSGGNLGAGDAATNGIFTIGGNLTLQGNTTLRISKSGGVKTNDQVAVTGTISYGGVLNIANITGDGTPLAPGDTFQIFNAGGSGNFSSIVSSGATYSFNPATGVLMVLTIGPGTFTNPTGITSFSMQGANVVITASNGQSGDAYYLLSTTNVVKPLPQWKTVATNVLTANGSYTFIGTNVVVAGDLQQFYILSNTNYNY